MEAGVCISCTSKRLYRNAPVVVLAIPTRLGCVLRGVGVGALVRAQLHRDGAARRPQAAGLGRYQDGQAAPCEEDETRVRDAGRMEHSCA
jgi:hypothetical protein